MRSSLSGFFAFMPLFSFADSGGLRGHVLLHRVQDLFGFLRLFFRLAVEYLVHPSHVDLAAPFADDDRRDTIADEVRERASLRHEAVDAEHPREPRDRTIAD